MKITLQQSLDRANEGLELYDSLYVDDEPYFNEEKEWEKHLDYQHFLRHGGDPWWAQ